MGTMLFMIPSPLIRSPLREITAEIAQPEGILTCPSFFILFLSFLTIKKASISAEEADSSAEMNAIAHPDFDFF